MEYSEQAKRKIQLYFAANYLYERGFSHPQVVGMLKDYEEDETLVISMADKAMKDEWRKAFNEVQRLLAEGKNFQEALESALTIEPDPEVAHFICRRWYDVQSYYADTVIESSINITEGIDGVIYCSLALGLLFWIEGSVIIKIIMGLVLVVSVIRWLYGLKQRKVAKSLQKIIDEDYTQLGKLI